ncbi:hypothetical protein Q9966_002074 [Columba livia]|nr:hypothetical protein Q9966_002074 [Columba livia]
MDSGSAQTEISSSVTGEEETSILYCDSGPLSFKIFFPNPTSTVLWTESAEEPQDLLALLHEQGPSTEGIFWLVASECASREIREALDSGTEVHLASQPVHIPAVILKQCSQPDVQPLALQDFLRKIPSKLLVAELYQE